MKLKPTRRAFLLRNSVFLYYFFLSLLAIVAYGIAYAELPGIKLTDILLFMVVWVALTILPGIVLAFKRRRFGWVIWPVLMNVLGLGIRWYFADSIDTQYGWIVEYAPFLVFSIVSILALAIQDAYRRTFGYEISEGCIKISYGFMKSNQQIIPLRHVTNVLLDRSILARLLGVGNVVIVTSSGMGSGDRGVFGGVMGGGGAKRFGAGVHVGAVSQAKEFVADPKNCIFGVSKPARVSEEIERILAKENDAHYQPRQE